LLSEEEHGKFFLNIESIFLLNRNFCDDLKSRLENYTFQTQIGTLLIKYVQFFKIYLVYCCDFNLEFVELMKNQNVILIEFNSKGKFSNLL
jgi:hypothetical protein